MSPYKKYLIDLRDFSYMSYAKRYGKVSAKSWPGYKGMFLVIHLPYYISILMISKRMIPNSDLNFFVGWEPNMLELIIVMIVISAPYALLTSFFLNRLEKEKQILVKEIKSQWKHKQIVGLVTAIGGFITMFGYMKLSEYY